MGRVKMKVSVAGIFQKFCNLDYWKEIDLCWKKFVYIVLRKYVTSTDVKDEDD